MIPQVPTSRKIKTPMLSLVDRLVKPIRSNARPPSPERECKLFSQRVERKPMDEEPNLSCLEGNTPCACLNVVYGWYIGDSVVLVV